MKRKTDPLFFLTTVNHIRFLLCVFLENQDGKRGLGEPDGTLRFDESSFVNKVVNQPMLEGNITALLVKLKIDSLEFLPYAYENCLLGRRKPRQVADSSFWSGFAVFEGE
jgi:hypothetical protein